MNVLTISIEIQGQCKILQGVWELQIGQQKHLINHQQSSFSYLYRSQAKKGWNQLRLYHLDHPDYLTDVENKIYSCLNIHTIKIDNCVINTKLLVRSGMKFYNPHNNKTLYHKNLGEPFIGVIKFYLPIEHWSFAITDIDNYTTWTKIANT